MEKTLGITSATEAKEKISDLQLFGDGDTWVLISKASSQKEGWMKSTKAMQIDGVGCIVQVTTQQRNTTGFTALKRDAEGKVEIQKSGETIIGPMYDHSEEAFTHVIAEAVTFVPGVKIQEAFDDNKKVISRKLVYLTVSDKA